MRNGLLIERRQAASGSQWEQGNESRLTCFRGEHLDEIVRVPRGGFAFPLDGLFSLHGADLIEDEVAHAGDVLSAVAPPEARLILLECHIEHPMQAVFNAPMGAGGLREVPRVQDAR